MRNINVIKYRWLIIISTLLLVGLAIIPLLDTKTNSDLESYLPKKMESRINSLKIEKVFGKNDPLIILFECDDVLNDSTLKRIRALSKEFNRMNEFDMVMSLFDAKNIKGEYGAMVVDPVVGRIPKTETKKEKLRNEIIANDLAYKLIVSEDFHYTTIILNSPGIASDEVLLSLINKQLETYPGSEKVTLFGLPYMRAEANEKITKDFMILLPIGLVMMFLFLIFSFKQKRGAILPFMVVACSIILAMAIIPILGWEMSIIGILIPVMMIAIANNYGVHFVTRFQELRAEKPDASVMQVVSETTTYLKRPIILTGLTTIVGVSGLITHILLPAKQMGIASAIGIAFALLLSLTLIPAVMVMLRKGKVIKTSSDKKISYLDRALSGIAKGTTSKPRIVVYFFVAFLLLSAFGFTKFQLAADNNKIFADNHPYNQTLVVADKEFGGTKTISVLFEGNIKDPALLKNMDKYATELKKMPEVGNVNSIAKILRFMSKAINDPQDDAYDKIPNSREAVAQYFELYSMSGDPEDFEDFVDFDYTKALLTVQYKADDMATINKVENMVKNLTKNDENVKIIGGYSLMDKELSEAVAKGQVNSLLFAFIAIAILLIIIFKSFNAGIIGSIPLIFTVVSVFGIMGWLGIELNIVTALLSSISIGLGVDYSIHLFWRLKKELREGNSYEDSVRISLKTIGRGITINAFSVIIGFSVLFLSSFPYIQSFAFLIIASLFLCLMGAIILIPAICVIFKPKFLKK
ncbi:MAG TPA: MMPL family transporter [Bacteroidales bacterium]|nr:MMPL family transporter [Bacteroidales bacterium]